MKKLALLVVSALFCGFLASGEESEYTGVTDVYKFSMTVKVPRIYDNTCSLGYRKYQVQKITGYLKLKYPKSGTEECGQPEVSITCLENQTHKINGKKITYSVSIGDGLYTRINLIGDNKKNVFKTPSVCFYMDAEPSYNIGEDDEDNSLLCTLAGSGSSKQIDKYEYKWVYEKGRCVCKKVKTGKIQLITSMNGYLAGTLGCGCRAYGHTSPTRVNGEEGPTDQVDDVAAVYGTWKAVYDYTIGTK